MLMCVKTTCTGSVTKGLDPSYILQRLIWVYAVCLSVSVLTVIKVFFCCNGFFKILEDILLNEFCI